MYINFWYAVAVATNVTDKPLKVEVLGQPLVVFRDSKGQAHALSNTCTHRGGSLAGGKVIGDCVACPYHGWEFNGDGQCTKIPSLGREGKIPPRTRIDAYPVQERCGVIFAFLGDLPEGERPPLQAIPEEGQDGWRYTVHTWDVACNYERGVENAMDPAHNEFVHPTHGFSGERDDYKTPDIELTRTDWGAGFMATFFSPGLPDPKMKHLKPEIGTMRAGSGHHGPNAMWTYIHFTETSMLHQYLWETPLDDTHTRVFLINYRNHLLDPALDAKIGERNMVVASQDVAVLEAIEPTITPNDMTHENMTVADKAIVAYREALKGWDAKGWRIDSQAVVRNKGRVAYAIPSPGRRQHKGWALDAVPLVTHAQSAQAAAE